MKAIIVNEFGGTDQLHFVEMAIPVILADEVLIQVKAISINPVDVKTRAGKGMAARMKEFKPLVLGWDISGVITAVGDDVKDFKKGDEVFGMVNFPGHGKAYAEYVAAPANHLARKPTNISHEQAAAATLAALTAWEALTQHAKVLRGQRVLIHAASGGVGHYAVQIAKHFGAYVIGTSSAANRNFVMSLGADEHIDYRAQQLDHVIAPVDFVLDTVGGDTVENSLSLTNRGGTIISILGGKASSKAEEQKINCSSFLVQSNGSNMKQLASLLEKNILKSHVTKIYPFASMADAHAHVETGRTVGKVVVSLE